MVYHNAFEAIETYMTDRASVNDELRFNIHNYVRVGRNEGVKCFDAIVSYCIRKVVDLAYVKRKVFFLPNLLFFKF